MVERIVASKFAIGRSSRFAPLFGGIGVATATLIASANLLLQVPLFPKQELPRPIGTERASHFAGFAELAHAVKPAVVAVIARTTEVDLTSRAPGSPEGPRSRFSTSQGSGFFISADGYAVTSNHVIKGSASVEIRTDEGDVYKARVIGTDAMSDLAVIKADGRRNFVHVKFAEQPPQVGDWIIAVGNPFGLGGTVTAGIVSARGRDVEKESDAYQDLLQIDAPINKGNSGGPTFDVSGNVVGVNTIILSPTGGSVGIAFAIPSDKAKLITEQLKERGAVTRGWLGIQFQSVLPEIADSLELAAPAGILIADVHPTGPAAKAGIAAGDLVDSVNGEIYLPSATSGGPGKGVILVFDRLANGQGGTDGHGGFGTIAMGPDNLFIHVTGMSDAAWHKVKDVGGQVSIAFPIEMNMRHGMPPIIRMQQMGMEPSLSSDVEVTLTADFFTQMRSAMNLQRLVVNQMTLDKPNGNLNLPDPRNWELPQTAATSTDTDFPYWPTPPGGVPAPLTTRDVLRYATINGAKHLRLDKKTGSLTPGKEADIIILDAQAINVAPLNNVPGAVVSLMDRTNVETVIVAGKVRKWKGRLLDVNLDNLRRQLENSRDHVFSEAQVHPLFPGQFDGRTGLFGNQ